MNLMPQFIGSAGSGTAGLSLDAMISVRNEVIETAPIIEVSVPADITTLALDFNYVNETNIALVDVVEQVTVEEVIVNISTESSISLIDNNFEIPIDMSVGSGFPVHIGEVSVYDESLDALSVDANITTEATAYLLGDVHPASDINVDVYTENTVTTKEAGLINLGVDRNITDVYVKVDATNTLVDESNFSIGVNRVSNEQLSSMVFESTVLAVDVLMDAVVFADDQIVYQVADIDRGMQDGLLTVHPGKWSAAVMNVPLAEDGSHATVSNTIIPALSEKYGADIHTKISMLISRDPLSGEELNYVVTDGYSTPAGSINDFKLCELRDNVFYPVPFVIKSITGETLTITW